MGKVVGSDVKGKKKSSTIGYESYIELSTFKPSEVVSYLTIQNFRLLYITFSGMVNEQAGAILDRFNNFSGFILGKCRAAKTAAVYWAAGQKVGAYIF